MSVLCYEKTYYVILHFLSQFHFPSGSITATLIILFLCSSQSLASPSAATSYAVERGFPVITSSSACSDCTAPFCFPALRLREFCPAPGATALFASGAVLFSTVLCSAFCSNSASAQFCFPAPRLRVSVLPRTFCPGLSPIRRCVQVNC